MRKCTIALHILAYGLTIDSVNEYIRIVETTIMECLQNFRKQRRKTVNQNREEGHDRLFNEYFSPYPIYIETQFRRRFRMQRHVFLGVVEALDNQDEYFQMRVNATHRKGISSLHKCTVALYILAYGSTTDSICAIFGNEYLRRSNNEDTKRLLQMGATRDFLEWKDCPIAWKCKFCRGDHDNPTMIVEVVASQYSWAVDRTQYDMGYYLADHIYSDFGIFVKTMLILQGEKILFTQQQESTRRDVKRALKVF
ncbi:hypothetical protein HKD37_17G046457 [Glycine soja]